MIQWDNLSFPTHDHGSSFCAFSPPISGAAQGPHSMSVLFDHLIKNQIKCINVKKMTKPN